MSVPHSKTSSKQDILAVGGRKVVAFLALIFRTRSGRAAEGSPVSFSSVMAFRHSARAFRAIKTPHCSLKPVAARSAAYSRSSSVCCMASQAGPPAGPKYYILNYKYVPDIVEKRGPYREAHLGAANQKLQAGKLIMAGAAGDPVEGAVFIWKNATKEEIEAFVKSDPYVLNGLVPEYNIKPYAVVVGSP